MTKTLAKTINVAVAGNPNSGKTTIFNKLTGARQHVGNYPGVTVEWKRGTLRRGDLQLELIDLPGTYSLTAFSEEELVARDYLLGSKPDVVVEEHGIHMPSPSFYPIVAAAGVAILGAAIVFISSGPIGFAVLAVGAVVTLWGIVGWAAEPATRGAH